MKSKIALALGVTLVIGGLAGIWLANVYMVKEILASSDKLSGSEPKVLYYRNPMNPAITSPVFQKDDMGMDYIAVYANDAANTGEPAGTVVIDPVVVQNIGVRTTRVSKQPISRRINALGRVDFNEERLARLHPKTTGWIESLRVDQTGSTVKKNAILLSIYSPDLVATQREYLLALKNWESMSDRSAERIRQTTKAMLDSSLDRLMLLDVPAHQLHELKARRKITKYLHIHSPFAGTIMHIGAREGQYITPKDELFMIADLRKIWVFVDVYEDQMAWVKLGDAVEMQTRSAPGIKFSGKISFIYPYLEGKTRTVRARLEFDNADGILKPGMFTNVVLRAEAQAEAIVVPDSAIVRSGLREQVFVVRETGKYAPREVVLGLSADGYTQILQGLDEGEVVVTSSTFLIDSESKLQEATAKMLEAMNPEPIKSEMNMDDMSMDDMEMSNIPDTADKPTMNMAQ